MNSYLFCLLQFKLSMREDIKRNISLTMAQNHLVTIKKCEFVRIYLCWLKNVGFFGKR